MMTSHDIADPNFSVVKQPTVTLLNFINSTITEVTQSVNKNNKKQTKKQSSREKNQNALKQHYCSKQ